MCLLAVWGIRKIHRLPQHSLRPSGSAAQKRCQMIAFCSNGGVCVCVSVLSSLRLSRHPYSGGSLLH